MDKMLFQAAAEGNVTSMHKLLQEDPLILDRITVNSLSETPLHVAALLGHIDFVKEIIKSKPELTAELNSSQSSPLHLASAKGRIEVVKFLISANPHVCLVRDRSGMTPLHLAAIKGRLEVMELLLRTRPAAATVVSYRGETILHTCIRYCQLEALKLIMNTVVNNPEFINSKDCDGNTALHLAIADRQVETIKFLLTVATIDVNMMNDNEMTAMDILVWRRRDLRDVEIEESLKRARASGSMGNSSVVHIDQDMTTQRHLAYPDNHGSPGQVKKHISKRLFTEKEKGLEKMKGSLMVVASLIATMAFQAGVNPPSGVWQETSPPDSPGNPVPDPHMAGYSIAADNYANFYEGFLIVNTAGFIASLSIILLLMSGLPLRRRVIMWIMMVITWIAITAIALIYIFAIIVLTPDKQVVTLIKVLVSAVIVWLVLVGLLLLVHTIRLIVKAVRKLRKSRKGQTLG